MVAKADRDLEAAEHLLTSSARLAGIVAFHAQQTVEKYLKAFLVFHQVSFPRTHDIRKLLEYVDPVNPDLALKLRHTDFLTPFGVEIRYPGDAPELSPGGEFEAIAAAKLTREVTRPLLRTG